MIKDLLKDRPGSEAADVCIVGAGAAGIVLAVELVRLGKRVVLLEGGGTEIEEASQDPYASELTGLPHKGIHTGRFRAKGGTTTKWGGQILELDEIDFEARPGVPESGWPFRKDELSPYYERALKLEGLDKVLRKDQDVWAAIGRSTPTFEGLESYCSRWCPEPNFGLLHRATLEDSESLVLWLHANAVDLVLEGDEVRGVTCRTMTGLEATFEATQYVFCLGAIESSRFFLQPRPEGLPWNRSGLLGKHFQDHVDCNAASVEVVAQDRFHELFDNVFVGGFKYHPKLRLSPALEVAKGTLNVAATMNFESDLDEALSRIKTTVKNMLRGRWSDLRLQDVGYMLGHLPLLCRQVWRYKVEHRAYNPASATVHLRVHCEQEPSSTSSITLAESRDGLGLYRTQLNWQISEQELATIRQYVQVAQASLQGVATIIPNPMLMAGSAEFRLQCDDSNHHMGGMRMSVAEQDGVVNADLRMHGTRNLYVCSGAVFPTSGFSNPTHTLLALAVRLADHLAR